ncbi:hypothetical protein ACFWDG_25190 [Peribacillus sp. NPDC060186]
MSIALDILSKTKFSMNFKERYDVLGGPSEPAMRIAVKRMGTLLQLPSWVPTKKQPRMNKLFEEIINTVIGNRPPSPEDFMKRKQCSFSLLSLSLDVKWKRRRRFNLKKGMWSGKPVCNAPKARVFP